MKDRISLKLIDFSWSTSSLQGHLVVVVLSDLDVEVSSETGHTICSTILFSECG